VPDVPRDGCVRLDGEHRPIRMPLVILTIAQDGLSDGAGGHPPFVV
jgi:hypothetical protein